MQFAIKAVDSAAQVVAVRLEAADEASAQELARQRGYVVLALRRTSLLGYAGIPLRRDFPTTLFSIELVALLDAGLNIVEALQTLAEKESKVEHRRLLTGLLDALYRGEPMSRALATFPQAFSSLFVATIRSSEHTGNVKEA